MVTFYKQGPYERYYMENKHGWWEWKETHPCWTPYWDVTYCGIDDEPPASTLQKWHRCSSLEVLVITGLTLGQAGRLRPIVA